MLNAKCLIFELKIGEISCILRAFLQFGCLFYTQNNWTDGTPV